jgi:two-component system, NarL family, response regulator DevR
MISVAPTPSVPRHERAPSAATRMRLLVVDDHPAMRAGLRDLLTDEVDFDVVAVAATAEDALVLAAREPIDLAVVDYQLGGRNGLWLSRKLKRLPDPPAVLIYSAYTDGVLAAAAVVAEADAIVSKATLGFELCDAIRRVAGGHRHMPLLPRAVAEGVRRRLDDQEKAIFGMLLAGIPPTEVAAMLGLSASDLESRLWSMLRRLDGPPGARTT